MKSKLLTIWLAEKRKARAKFEKLMGEALSETENKKSLQETQNPDFHI